MRLLGGACPEHHEILRSLRFLRMTGSEGLAMAQDFLRLTDKDETDTSRKRTPTVDATRSVELSYKQEIPMLEITFYGNIVENRACSYCPERSTRLFEPNEEVLV